MKQLTRETEAYSKQALSLAHKTLSGGGGSGILDSSVVQGLMGKYVWPSPHLGGHKSWIYMYNVNHTWEVPHYSETVLSQWEGGLCEFLFFKVSAVKLVKNKVDLKDTKWDLEGSKRVKPTMMLRNNWWSGTKVKSTHWNRVLICQTACACIEGIWQSAQHMYINHQNTVWKLACHTRLQSTVLACCRPTGFSVGLVWMRREKAKWRWLEVNAVLKALLVSLVVPLVTIWMQVLFKLYLAIRFWGLWRELWVEASLSLMLPKDCPAMTLKASSVQRYIRGTAWVRMLKTTCVT